MDLPLAGGPFTWSNIQENPTWSRLDRFHPLIGKSSFQVLYRKGILDCVMIISRFFLIGVPDRSSLRICG